MVGDNEATRDPKTLGQSGSKQRRLRARKVRTEHQRRGRAGGGQTANELISDLAA